MKPAIDIIASTVLLALGLFGLNTGILITMGSRGVNISSDNAAPFFSVAMLLFAASGYSRLYYKAKKQKLAYYFARFCELSALAIILGFLIYVFGKDLL